MTESDGLKVVLVGHCGPDSHLLKRAVADAVQGAAIVMNTEEKSLWNSSANLLLINRVLDGWYSDDSGLRLIAEAKKRGVPALLISNYPEAQAAAVAAGGAPGFGKSEARTDKATRAIRGALKLD